jgi:hypothetical protein
VNIIQGVKIMTEFMMGPTCQSCGMALTHPSNFGTTETGALNLEYCRFCFEKGKFNEPDITLEDMASRIAATAVKKKKGASEEVAKEMAMKMLPQLKRWKGADKKQ